MTLLIKNALTPSGKKDILIENDLIKSTGEIPSNNQTVDKIIDASGFITIPGFVNSHTHSYMSLYKNYADDLPFDKWLFGAVMPMEDATSGEDAYYGSLLGFAEMLKTGTTSCLDMHMFTPYVAKAADKIGIRAVLSRGLVGEGKNDEGGIRRINELKQELELYKNHSRISFMAGPHAIYTADREYLEMVLETADSLNIGIHIHLSETEYEVSESLKKYSKSPVEYLDEIGVFNRHTVAAHCVHLSENDIQILAEKEVYIAHNPKSNLKLANGIAPISRLSAKGAKICIGTDGSASNNALNMFSEMNYTALLQKGITKVPICAPAAHVFKWATKIGSEALCLNSGEILPGKKADITLININNPAFQPFRDDSERLIASLVYGATGAEVDTVIVDGEIVLESGKLTKVDEEELYKKAFETFNKIRGNLK